MGVRRLSLTCPVLPPDPVGDLLASCFRMLLGQLATDKAMGAVPTVEVDGPGCDQPSQLAEMDRELTAAT